MRTRATEVDRASAPVAAGEPSRASATAPARRVRLRVLGLILVSQALLIAWVGDSEISRSIYLICYALMMPTVLFLLCARFLRRWLPFETHEILLAYIVLTATIPVVGFGGLRFLMPGMGYLAYFAEGQQQWRRYLPFLRPLPVLHDPAAIHTFFHGGHGVPWAAWAGPICFWSAYLLLLSGIWLGLAAVLHRFWIHQERLAFPIAVMPLQLVDPRDDLFRRPLFWAGFAIPVVLESLLALHDWYPAVPAFQLKAYGVKPPLFPTPPWNAIPDVNIAFYPLAIGLAYFVPGSVSFSCWFFWILTRLTYVAGAMFGIEAAGTGGARFPYPEEQAAGAWIALAGMMVWGARRHWATLFRAFTLPEFRAMRKIGLLALACALLAATMMGLAGIRPLIGLGILAVYVAYVLSGARVRAETGGMWTFAPLVWTPFRVMTGLAGHPALPDRALVAGGLFDLVHVDIRAQSLPFLMEGLKIADTAGLRWRTVLLWVGVGTVTALALGWWSGLTNFYAAGAATSKSNAYAMVKVQVGMTQMEALANSHGGWDRAGTLGMLVGAGITLLLAALRTRLVGFPFHPLGYVLCNTLTMKSFFVPFFLAWSVKVLVLRYGGNRLYRVSQVFFVGLILGDIVTQAAWTIISRALDIPVYQFLS